ncbi:hypothetical protein E4P41_09405 [Geodermatophilus sp. DF01-2]|uniref:hypothetical protein n=1 Tax=Geodermatophilus sp. DF01-2 TaxID=2559610 RepID=UPI00107471EA|nr:hypothetical protein [Geodermatophilus sp. DF01_2]TFV61755.1 hypothetical protein E4P41_09405 [Geodermatophilus sp. DF01_2]
MTPPAAVRLGGLALLLALLPGCAPPVDDEATAVPAASTPATPEQLEDLVVPAVPSGLPRVPDGHLAPPAGEKSVEDVAGYAEDPAREREVLADYGYRFGWERYWGSGTGPLTSVFAHQFETRGGAAAFTGDVAAHDAEVYGGVLREDPPDLPEDCRLLVLEEGAPAAGVTSPAAFAWCARGVFSVAVTAVAGSVEAATEEVQAVVAAQLERLPPS